MAAPTKPCDVKILLANSEPSTHGTCRKRRNVCSGKLPRFGPAPFSQRSASFLKDACGRFRCYDGRGGPAGIKFSVRTGSWQAGCRRHLWPPPAGSQFPAPIGSEPCPVPTDHGVRLDDRQRAPNIGEQPKKADEYQSVDAAGEKPLWRGPPQDVDLLAQYQDLRLKLCSRSEQVAERPPSQSAKVPHQATTSPDSHPLASRTRFPIRTDPLT